jgi:hypothetical protein
MINIPLTPFALQFLFHDAISFHHVKGPLVKRQIVRSFYFPWISHFPLDKRITVHIYVVLTFLILTNGNLSYVHFFYTFSFVWSSLMQSHPMYLFVCAMNASDQ